MQKSNKFAAKKCIFLVFTKPLVDCLIPNFNRFSLTFTGKNMILQRQKLAKCKY